jgi:phosphate-selective porin OprO/OprP
MYGRAFMLTCALAAALIAASGRLSAEENQGYPAGYQGYPVSYAVNQPPVPPMGNQPPAPPMGNQPAGGENRPPDFGALPPAAPPSDNNLAKRVSDLEKQLADYAKAAADAKGQPPTKPLIAPSGRIQFDVANFSQNAASNAQFGNAQNSVGFRRARLALLGEYQIVDYIIEMDFANRGINSTINSKDQSTAFKDVYVQVRELPMVGNVRVGHFKECFGLEQVTSDNYTTFMERSVDDEGAFVPGRNDGIMAYNWTENQRATWAVGTFTNQTGFDQPPTFVYDHWGLDFTGRVTYLPWYDEPSGGRGLLHTGLDYTYRSAPDNTMALASRPESAFAPAIVNVTFTDVTNMQVAGAEAALVYGPLSLQSELFYSNLNHLTAASNDFYGGYAYVSYFLTGENRPYNRKMGVFDRVQPYQDFFRVHTGDGSTATGRGAWEVAYRFSYIDMLDGLTTKGAGIATDHTLGLNWYLNPFTRVMFNYVHSIDTYNVSTTSRITGGNLDIFEMRMAMDF